ncbi:MAG: DUF1302 family protein [Thermodesulfobacteriota bacterium]
MTKLCRTALLGCFAVALLLFAPLRAPAQESSPSLLGGFDEESPLASSEQASGDEQGKTLPVRLSGYARLCTLYDFGHSAPDPGWTDFRGFQRLRPELFAELTFDPASTVRLKASGKFWHDFIFDIRDSNNYSQQYIDDMENRAELWEAFVQASPKPGLEIKVGRQIVVWGNSENLRVTDVLNPLDMREIGMTDIEDLRLPIFMSKVDLVVSKVTASALAIHEIRSDWVDAFGSPYSPYPFPPPKSDELSDSIENTGFGFSLSGRFTGFDAAFYAADYYDHTSHIAVARPMRIIPAFPLPVIIPPEYERQYSKLNMFGGMANIAVGNTLLKVEAAFKDGFEFLLVPGQKKSRLDTLAGIEYSGITDTEISVDYSVQYYLDWEPIMAYTPEDIRQSESYLAARVTHDMLHDTLHLTVVGMLIGDWGSDGWFARAQVEYDWTDDFSTMLGGVLYGSGDMNLFQYLDDNDRIFLNLKYSF